MQEGKKGLLVVTRYTNEAIKLTTQSGEVIEVVIVQVKGKQVRVGVSCDRSVDIARMTDLERNGGVPESTKAPRTAEEKQRRAECKGLAPVHHRPQTLADVDPMLLQVAGYSETPRLRPKLPAEVPPIQVRPGLKKRKRLTGLSTEHATMPDELLDSAVNGNS